MAKNSLALLEILQTVHSARDDQLLDDVEREVRVNVVPIEELDHLLSGQGRHRDVGRFLTFFSKIGL